MNGREAGAIRLDAKRRDTLPQRNIGGHKLPVQLTGTSGDSHELVGAVFIPRSPAHHGLGGAKGCVRLELGKNLVDRDASWWMTQRA